ncbi:MAG: hypothetical protein QOH50_2802, partial [Kribbellaceae bacterium]|nr:hypothetical protein [Kribbellaceae bacterium]
MITADASAVWFTVNRGTAVGRIELTGEGT